LHQFERDGIIGLECSPNFFCQLAELGLKLGLKIFALGIAREHWGTQQGGFERKDKKVIIPIYGQSSIMISGPPIFETGKSLLFHLFHLLPCTAHPV